jgi:hypothetical protein
VTRLPAALLLLAVALPAAGQVVDPFAGMTFDDRLEFQVEAGPEPSHPRIVAAVWCVAQGSPAAPVEDGEEEVGPEEVGCDFGAGAEAVGHSFRQGRLSAVVVGGVKSFGVGVSWAWLEWDRPVAVGVLLVAPYDSQGIYADGAAVALAATVGLFGGGGGP